MIRVQSSRDMRFMKLHWNGSHTRGLCASLFIFGLLVTGSIGTELLGIVPEQEATVLRRGTRAIQDLKSIVPENYSIFELPPTSSGGPVNVKMSLVIVNVRDIKEVGEEISIELNLRISWKDSRLSHVVDHLVNSTSDNSEYVLLTPSVLGFIWHPDLFIDHVKKIDQPFLMASQPSSLRMYPDNTLRYSSRVTITVACPMVFHYYPADTQKCHFDLKSYAYSDKEMILQWRDKNGAIFAENMDLSNFYITLDNPNTFLLKTLSGRAYSGLRFTILMTRQLSYHIIQTYIPSIVLVVISWLSFLVNPDAVPGRMTLLMTILLTLIAMFAAVRTSTPNVSYVKALDIWMVVCVFFVFLALMEFTVVLKIKSRKAKKKKPIESDAPPIAPSTAEDQALAHFHFLRGTKGGLGQAYYPEPISPSRSATPRNYSGQGQQIPNESSFGGEYFTPRRPASQYEFLDHPSLTQRFPQSERSPPVPGAQGQMPVIPTPEPPVVVVPPPAPPQSNKEELITSIETMASIILPILFTLFNLTYWPLLIIYSEYFTHGD